LAYREGAVPGRFGGVHLVGNFHGIAEAVGAAAIAKIKSNEDEGSTVDFKREQYPFAKATDEVKTDVLIP
jgi:hypothetical protein